MTTIDIDTKFDDSRVQAHIKAVQARTKNLRPWFDDVADDIARFNQANFDSMGALSGGWSPLAPEYARWKGVHFPGRPIMQRTGRLKDSVTNRPFGIERILLRSMTIGTAVDYAKFHQFGTRKMPRREIWVVPETMIPVWKKRLARYITKGSLQS